MRYALDTNTITFILKKEKQVLDNLRVAAKSGAICVIPPVAYNEIIRGLLELNSKGKIRNNFSKSSIFRWMMAICPLSAP